MCRTKLVPLATLEPAYDDDHHLSSSSISENDHDCASPGALLPLNGGGGGGAPLRRGVHHITNAPYGGGCGGCGVAVAAAAVGAGAGAKRHGGGAHHHVPAPSRKGLSNRFREIKPWKIIELPENIASQPRLPPGFNVEVYDSHLTQHFEVESAAVVPTLGALSYVQHYNETGPYGRFRFQLCHNFASGRCCKGFECTYLHITELPAPTVVHVQGGSYVTMPAGVNLFVYTPHSQAPPQVIPSEYLIQTQGALAMMQSILEGQQANVQRPQHCAHFQYKRMCNRGYECGFLHSTIPAPR